VRESRFTGVVVGVSTSYNDSDRGGKKLGQVGTEEYASVAATTASMSAGWIRRVEESRVPT
jgi:hypothetical protein